MGKKLVSLLAKTFVFLTTFFVGIVLSLSILLSFSPVSKRLSPTLLQLSLNVLEKQSGHQIKVDQIEEVEPFHWKLHNVHLSAEKAINIKNAEMSFSPLYLFMGHITFRQIILEDVDGMVLHTNTYQEPETPSSFHFPFSLDVNYFNVKNLILNELETPLNINLDGNLEFSSLTEALSGQLRVALVENPKNKTSLSFLIHPQKDDYLFHLILREKKPNLISKLIGTDLPRGFEASLNGTLENGPDPKVHFDLSCKKIAPDPSFTLNEMIAKGTLNWDDKPSLSVHHASAKIEHAALHSTVEGSVQIDHSLQVTQGLLKIYVDLENIPLQGDEIYSEILFHGAHNDLFLEATTTTPSLEHDNDILKDVVVKTFGRITQTNFSLDHGIDFNFEQIPFKGSLSMNWEYEDLIHLDRMRLWALGLEGNGDLEYSIEEGALRGQILADVPEISDLLKNSTNQISGKASLAILFDKPEGSTQFGQAQLNIKSLESNHYHIPLINAVIRAEDLFESPYATATLDIQEAESESWSLKNLCLSTSCGGDRTTYPVTLTFEGSHNANTFDFHSDATVRLLWPGIICSLDSANGTISETPFSLDKPFEMTFTPQKKSTELINLTLGTGSLSILGEESGGEVSASVEGAAVQLPILFSFLSPKSKLIDSGSFEFKSELKGLLTDPELTLEAQLNDVKLKQSFAKSLHPIQGKISLDIKADQLRLDGNIEGFGEQPLHCHALVPIEFSLYPFLTVLPQDRPLSASLMGETEVAPLIRALFPGNTTITGKANIDIKMEGDFVQPQINGTVGFRDGTYESLSVGCSFNNIKADILIQDDIVTLNQLTASDGGSGTIRGAGTYKLDMAKSLPFNFNFQLNHVVVLRQDFMMGTASGSLRLSGDSNESVLSGKLTVDQALATIPKKSSVDLNALDITFVNTPKGKKKPGAHLPQKSSNPMKFDIEIDAPRKIFAKSKELESEWRGKLNIQGHADEVLVYGSLRCLQGDFRIRGKSFWIERGAIDFDGNLDKKTSVFVAATHDIDRLTVEAILKGPIKNPSLSFRSNPPMSQKEIFSRLLFNTSAKDNMAFDDSDPGHTQIDIPDTDDESSLDYLAHLQKFGIDRIDFDHQSDGGENLSVNIGKYLTRGLFVSLNRGISRDTHRLSLEAKIIPHVKIQAEVDDDRAGRMLLMWKHDY